MAEQSGISWTDATFNPWWGCVKVSPACDHCYAATLAQRFGTEWGVDARRRFFPDKHWNEPVRWNAKALRDGVRRRVFCASMADVFETLPKGHPDTEALDAARARLWALIEATPVLDWLLLTKRPQSFERYLPDRWIGAALPGNIWLGTTVESEQFAWRMDKLASWKNAAVRFVSYEPALGPVDWEKHADSLDWLLVGGESGNGSRPMHPDWARAARDFCEDHGKVFHMKQWGNWLPWEPDAQPPFWTAQTGENRDGHGLFPAEGCELPEWDDGLWGIEAGLSHAAFQNVGKKTAGHLLDGEDLQHFPIVPAQRLPSGAAP